MTLWRENVKKEWMNMAKATNSQDTRGHCGRNLNHDEG
jgi:hypothetical protein